MKARARSVQIASATAVIVALFVLFWGSPLVAQQSDNQPTLSPQEKNGQMFFFQRCSLCHLPPLVGPTEGARLPFGPLLYGFLDNARNETRVRQVIRLGGAQMPGFQYALLPGEIEDVVAYLKSSMMKTPPEWFAQARARGPGAGRGGRGPID